MDSFQEQRKYPRIFFSGEEVALAKIAPAAGEKSFDVRLLNVSEGGIGFHLKRSAGIWLKVNDSLQLITLFGHPHLGDVSDLSMEVRWIMDEEYLDHVVVGCEFINLDAHNRELLQDFVLVALSEHKHQQQDVPS
ncbi:MAG TPA: PilZ domain-containing protein [Desulfobulbaceae bacterium]|nr:PilZ domain-containing protein [Desulfobulbaceae bacterium]HHD64826.1 PilZ domain-containing protein [Desulfobulbaceae bacterium]